MATVAHYWASCAGGLEFALFKEVGRFTVNL